MSAQRSIDPRPPLRSSGARLRPRSSGRWTFTPISPRAFRRQVRFHLKKLVGHLVQRLRRECFSVTIPCSARRCSPISSRSDRRRGGEMQPPHAAVVGIGAPLDQTARFQPVDQAADRDRLDLDDRGKFVLRHARLALQPAAGSPTAPVSCRARAPAGRHGCGTVAPRRAARSTRCGRRRNRTPFYSPALGHITNA